MQHHCGLFGKCFILERKYTSWNRGVSQSKWCCQAERHTVYAHGVWYSWYVGFWFISV